MCIIVVKKEGLKMPEKNTLESCFMSNKDGAGFMYAKNNKVVISKGYMTFDSFYKALNRLGDTTDIPVVLHFRITTHGGTSKQNCHPFPLSSKKKDLQKLNTTTNIGIAHNGIISSVIPSDGISDTMEYIKTDLYKLYKRDAEFFNRPETLNLIELQIGSKMAILNCDGTLKTIGDFKEDNGILYSNNSYTYYLEDYLQKMTWDSFSWLGIDKSKTKKVKGIGKYGKDFFPLDDDDFISLDGDIIFGYEEEIYITSSGRVFIYDEKNNPIYLVGAKVHINYEEKYTI